MLGKGGISVSQTSIFYLALHILAKKDVCFAYHCVGTVVLIIISIFFCDTFVVISYCCLCFILQKSAIKLFV